jgi:FHS family L-fucose permease-like MFS transporter
MKQYLQTPTEKIAPYVSLFWASLMIGRWAGSAGAFGFKGNTAKLMRIVLPILAFGIFIIANKIAGNNVSPFYIYLIAVAVLIFADGISQGNPARQLVIYSICGITSLLIGMYSGGMLSVYAYISVGLFCSTLWPCIFTLAIAGLGKNTNSGSGYLIMMIMGGGFISLLQGWLASDDLMGIRLSYWVGVACFLYLAFYGWKVNHILKNQGIQFDVKSQSNAH